MGFPPTQIILTLHFCNPSWHYHNSHGFIWGLFFTLKVKCGGEKKLKINQNPLMNCKMNRNHTHQGMDNELTSLGQVLGQQGASHVTAQGVLGEKKKRALIHISSPFPSFSLHSVQCCCCSIQLRVIFHPVLVKGLSV